MLGSGGAAGLVAAVSAGATARGQGGAPKEMLPFLSLRYYTTARSTDRSIILVCVRRIIAMHAVGGGVMVNVLSEQRQGNWMQDQDPFENS